MTSRLCTGRAYRRYIVIVAPVAAALRTPGPRWYHYRRGAWLAVFVSPRR